MSMLALLFAISTVEWYVINRLKTELWDSWEYGRYVTILISLVASFMLAFAYHLDIMVAVGLMEQATTAGIVLTGFALSSGSSAISEIIEAINKNNA